MHRRLCAQHTHNQARAVLTFISKTIIFRVDRCHALFSFKTGDFITKRILCFGANTRPEKKKKKNNLFERSVSEYYRQQADAYYFFEHKLNK